MKMRLEGGELFVRCLAALLATSSSIACSVSKNDPACADLAEATCNELVSCTSSVVSAGVDILRRYGDIDTCRARQTLACENRLAAPGTGNDSAVTESCARAIANLDCSDFLDNILPGECSPTGAYANGTACTFNGQCASAYCSLTKHADCGVCADAPAAGADCSASACGDGQSCVASTTTCQELVTEGGSCDASHPCRESLSCIGNTTTAPGTCQASITTEGTACGGTKGACQGDLGLACTGAAAAKTCTQVSYGADGAPCGALSDGSRAECQAGACFTDTGPAGSADLGTCRADAADGEACDLTIGPDCMAPARCVTEAGGTGGFCRVPVASACAG